MNGTLQLVWFVICYLLMIFDYPSPTSNITYVSHDTTDMARGGTFNLQLYPHPSMVDPS